mgnify:CR=1 FL=1
MNFILFVTILYLNHLILYAKTSVSESRKNPIFRKRIVEAESHPKLYPGGELKSLKSIGDIVHETSSNAIFSVGLNPAMELDDVKGFVGTARLYFDGDIVLGINSTNQDVLQYLREHRVIVYNIELECNGVLFCRFNGQENQEMIPPAQLRYYLYQMWAQKYSPGSLLMVADFRDVFFQANPFNYRPHEWITSDLVVFLEPHPNKVINRCKFNGPWIGRCYGKEAVNRVGHNIVSCSGVTMGPRDGILVYVSAYDCCIISVDHVVYYYSLICLENMWTRKSAIVYCN